MIAVNLRIIRKRDCGRQLNKIKGREIYKYHLGRPIKRKVATNWQPFENQYCIIA